MHRAYDTHTHTHRTYAHPTPHLLSVSSAMPFSTLASTCIIRSGQSAWGFIPQASSRSVLQQGQMDYLLTQQSLPLTGGSAIEL